MVIFMVLFLCLFLILSIYIWYKFIENNITGQECDVTKCNCIMDN